LVILGPRSENIFIFAFAKEGKLSIHATCANNPGLSYRGSNSYGGLRLGNADQHRRREKEEGTKRAGGHRFFDGHVERRALAARQRTGGETRQGAWGDALPASRK